MKLTALLLALPLSGLAVCAQAQAAAGYEVAGQIKGLPDGTHIYLIDGGQRKRIDSATVQQGQFVLRGQLAEPIHAYVYAGRGPGSSKLADILLDNQRVQVKGSQPVYTSVAVSGSAIDQQWKEWLQEDTRLAEQRAGVGKSYRARLAQPDTTGAGLLKQQQTQLQQARVELLKGYVRRYHDTVVGAALPTMCTLSASLTAADYREMYASLTPRWQQSAFGHELLTQAGKRTRR
jgi:hypothetical protein